MGNQGSAVCNICGAKFRDHNSLILHMIEAHPKGKAAQIAEQERRVQQVFAQVVKEALGR